MSDKKKPLLMYPVTGDVAKVMFASNPEAAERSEVENPAEGMAVVIQDEGVIRELVAAFTETVKLMKADVVEELLIYPDNLDNFILDVSKLVELLVIIQATAKVGEEAQEEAEDEAK